VVDWRINLLAILIVLWSNLEVLDFSSRRRRKKRGLLRSGGGGGGGGGGGELQPEEEIDLRPSLLGMDGY